MLCSCGSNNSKASYTLADADEVLHSGAFEVDNMAPLDGFLISLLYGIEESTITEYAGYMAVNTSVSADELVVLILTDEEAAIAAEEACKLEHAISDSTLEKLKAYMEKAEV